MAVVGRIARAHGRRGQVIVNSETDFPDQRFQAGAELFVMRRGIIEPLIVTSVRFQRGRPVIGLAGVETMTAAEALAGLELRIPADRLVSLPDGSFYRHDLVGCRVETVGGDTIGVVADVEIGVGSRLVVRRGPGEGDRRGHVEAEVLIPLATEICRIIDPVAKRIVIDPPEGLLDLNAGRT
jgi:16S rRNA processing protein RimM